MLHQYFLILPLPTANPCLATRCRVMPGYCTFFHLATCPPGHLPTWSPAPRCEELAVQPRGTRGESGGQTGVTYDISNKHRLGYSEVPACELVSGS